MHLIATHFSTIMNLCILSYIQEPVQSTVRGGEGRGTERFKSVIVFQPFISWVPTLGLTGGFILFTIWSASLAPCRAGNDKELYSNTRVSIPGELWMNLWGKFWKFKSPLCNLSKGRAHLIHNHCSEKRTWAKKGVDGQGGSPDFADVN